MGLAHKGAAIDPRESNGRLTGGSRPRGSNRWAWKKPMASTTIPIVLKWMTLVNAFRNRNDAMSIKARAQLRAARALLERGQLDEFHLSIVTDDSLPVDQCIDCSIFLSSSLVRAERWHHNQKSRSSPQGDRQ
jgi:hypothetical protein